MHTCDAGLLKKLATITPSLVSLKAADPLAHTPTALRAKGFPVGLANTVPSTAQVSPLPGVRTKETPESAYVRFTAVPGGTGSCPVSPSRTSKLMTLGSTHPMRLNEPESPPAPTCAAWAGDGASQDPKYRRPRASGPSVLRDDADANPSQLTNVAAAFGNGVTVCDSSSSRLNNWAPSCRTLPSGTSTQMPTVTSVLNSPTLGNVLKR